MRRYISLRSEIMIESQKKLKRDNCTTPEKSAGSLVKYLTTVSQNWSTNGKCLEKVIK